jgi:hypothetical protein
METVMNGEIPRKVISPSESHETPVSANFHTGSETANNGRSGHSIETNTRLSGIPGVGNIPWGEHLCVFYTGKQELLKLVVPYLAAGLRNNEFCMWITGEPVTERDAIEALEAVLPQAQKYFIQKQLEIVPYQQWYLSSGAFNEEIVLQGWISKAHDAEAKGFAGLRLTGNPFWLRSEEEWSQFISYEKKVEAAIQFERMIALCTYPLERYPHEHMYRTLSAHGSTLLNMRTEWRRLELCRPSSSS